MIVFRNLSLLFVATVMAMSVSSAVADDEDWAGYYKGLDLLDGSVDRLSIVPLGNGTFDVRMVSSTVSLCDGEPGWIVAKGRRVNDKTLARESAVLHCAGAEPRSISDSTYTRDDDTEILTLEAPDDGRKLYYHRLSDD